MNTDPTTDAKSLFEGIKELLDDAFDAKHPEAKAMYCTLGTAQALGHGDRPKLDLVPTVEAIWQRIATNWVESGCPWRGKMNWRWKLQTDFSPVNQERRPEVRWNRTLAKTIAESTDSGFWANEIPTGSGLAAKGAREPGGLDFAYSRGPEHVCLIELKIDADNADNPISAAFQVVSYGMFLRLAQLVPSKLFPKATPRSIARPAPLGAERGGNESDVSSETDAVSIDEKWRKARCIDLRVLAPSAFYDVDRNHQTDFTWFEQRLNSAVRTFGAKRGLRMTFAFCRFDGREPTTSTDVLKYLKLPGTTHERSPEQTAQ